MAAVLDRNDGEPRCDKCGVEITTGMMAVFCPLGTECEFYPKDAEGQEFILNMRYEVQT